MNFNEAFPLKVYINLDHRSDRDVQAKQEFEKLGINPIRRSGIVPNEVENSWWRGTAGCLASHFTIIQAAMCLDTNVFIFEDDLLTIGSNPMDILNKACSELPESWDFLYGGANIMAPATQVSEHLARLTHCQSTIFYGINKRFLRTVFNSIHLDNIDKPIDVIYSDMAPHHNFYITVPMVAIQRDSYSDIEGHDVEYSSYLEKRYWENLVKA